MTLLTTHLEQIALSSTALSELPFPPPKPFTNALLHTNDITTLIRDTDTHERALFAAPSSPPTTTTTTTATTKRRRTTIHPHPQNNPPLRNQPRTLISNLLRSDLPHNHETEPEPEPDSRGRDRGEIDLSALLDGAERLTKIYPIPGAGERLAGLRKRFQRVGGEVERYEGRVGRLGGVLEGMRRGEEEEEKGGGTGEGVFGGGVSEEDLVRVEEEVRELEARKRGLEERVLGMERDLGGLMR